MICAASSFANALLSILRRACALMTMNLIPADAPAIVNFSGGRSSGYMVKRLRDNGDLDRDDVHVVFCNTGKEREETYDFIRDVGEKWGVEIVWLEYEYRPEATGRKKGEYKTIHKVVDYESADRSGKPFESLILGKCMLPNVAMRICTSEMKVGTVWRWAKRDMEMKEWYSVLGIRLDEERRLERMRGQPPRFREKGEKAKAFPLVVTETTKRDVDDFWRGNDFDLGIPSWQGNCDLCFMKGKSNLLRTIKANPELAQWWIRMENSIVKMRHPVEKKELARFRKEYSVLDLFNQAQNQNEFELVENEGGIDCFCGD